MVDDGHESSVLRSRGVEPIVAEPNNPSTLPGDSLIALRMRADQLTPLSVRGEGGLRVAVRTERPVRAIGLILCARRFLSLRVMGAHLTPESDSQALALLFRSGPPRARVQHRPAIVRRSIGGRT